MFILSPLLFSNTPLNKSSIFTVKENHCLSIALSVFFSLSLLIQQMAITCYFLQFSNWNVGTHTHTYTHSYSANWIFDHHVACENVINAIDPIIEFSWAQIFHRKSHVLLYPVCVCVSIYLCVCVRMYVWVVEVGWRCYEVSLTTVNIMISFPDFWSLALSYPVRVLPKKILLEKDYVLFSRRKVERILFINILCPASKRYTRYVTAFLKYHYEIYRTALVNDCISNFRYSYAKLIVGGESFQIGFSNLESIWT